jgi:hypothetical protein
VAVWIAGVKRYLYYAALVVWLERHRDIGAHTRVAYHTSTPSPLTWYGFALLSLAPLAIGLLAYALAYLP